MSSYSANQFYNDELSRLQQKQQNADTILSSQERLAELNDSYRKRYAKYVEILIYLIVVFLVYLATVGLQMQFPVIPPVAVDIVTIVLIFLTVIYLFSAFAELGTRSLLNYDELDMPAYDTTGGVDVNTLVAKGQLSDKVANEICIGEECCAQGKTYDKDTNKCQAFTTLLDYEKLESAYNQSYLTGDFKRNPNATITPFDDATTLSFSAV